MLALARAMLVPFKPSAQGPTPMAIRILLDRHRRREPSNMPSGRQSSGQADSVGRDSGTDHQRNLSPASKKGMASRRGHHVAFKCCIKTIAAYIHTSIYIFCLGIRATGVSWVHSHRCREFGKKNIMMVKNGTAVWLGFMRFIYSPASGVFLSG